jgi:hypothetical protein
MRCPENRFGNDTIGRGANQTSNYCPGEINFPLLGNQETKKRKTYSITV